MPVPQELDERDPLRELTSDYSFRLRVESDGTFVTEWMTSPVESITGYTRDELQKRGWAPLRHPDDQPLVNRWRNAVRAGHDADGEWRIVRKDGDVRWLSTHSKATRDSHTGIVHILGATRDVTARKLAEQEERRRHSASLEQRIAERTRGLEARYLQAQRLSAGGEICAGVARAIINPLTALLGTIDLAQEAAVNRDRRLERIRQLAERIKNVVDSTPRLFPAEASFRQESVAELMAAVRDRIRERAGAAGVRLELDVADGLPPIVADRSLLERALVGIVENALDALSDGGCIWLHAQPVPGRNRVRVRIADDGPGVPEAICERIFEPFFTTRRGATGLGLAIAVGIVEGHRGRIDLEARPGGGTCLVVDLPAEPDPNTSRRSGNEA
jgi:PAS domain S-box-containing protein